jgi:hypothetical protein
MSRFELGGLGGPIPTVALPDPNLDENLAPQAFLLEDGVSFYKTDWENLGYTHYEVWCIGGAGGRGAGVGDIRYLSSQTRPRMSDADWALYKEMMHIYDSQLTPPPTYSKWDPTPHPGAPNGGYVPITEAEYREISFPNHDPYYVDTYREPWLVPNPNNMGGGGGGGGMHVAQGLLVDLPTYSSVEVGAAGIDAPAGQIHNNGVWTPTVNDLYDPPLWSPADTRLKELNNYFAAYRTKYPLPHPSFTNPQAGSDGGASSFNDGTCQASGGKGGRPGLIWSGSAWVKNGKGGDGGCGNRLIAGGGAAGSAAFGTPGAEGAWDGVIGKGGGGGAGGYVTTGSTGVPPTPTTVVTNASGGGKGSFSFGDTSVYGPGQTRQQFMQESYTFSPLDGSISSVTLTPSGKLVMAGIGGGAHRNDLKYGSQAPGYFSQGMVLIRLYKLD